MEITVNVYYDPQTNEIYARLSHYNGKECVINDERTSIVMRVNKNYLRTHKKMIEERIAKTVRECFKEKIVIKFEYQ